MSTVRPASVRLAPSSAAARYVLSLRSDGMTAHDPDDGTRLRLRCHVIECIGHRVIMKGGAQRACQRPDGLGMGPGVHHRIQTGCVVAVAVKLERVVRLRAIRVEGQIGESWKKQRTRPAEVVLDCRGELAA